MMRRPLILDVNPDQQDLDWEADLLERLEAHVVTCRGPQRAGACPILQGKNCGKVAAADGILFQLDLEREDHRAILEAYVERLDIPIRVVVGPGQREAFASELRDVEVQERPVGPAALDGFAAEVESEID